MPNLTNATNFFTRSVEGFNTTLASNITAGAPTVPILGSAGYNDGDTVCMVISPNAINGAKNTFTGVINTNNNTVNNCIWTEGTPAPQSTGAAIVDWVTATHWDLLLEGLLVQHSQTGAILPNSVTFDMLISGIFGKQITTAANTANGQGNYSYINLGGFKILWGTMLAATAGPYGVLNFGVNLPGNFFTANPTPFAFATALSGNSNISMFTGGTSPSAFTLNVQNQSTSTITVTPVYLLIGT